MTTSTHPRRVRRASRELTDAEREQVKTARAERNAETRAIADAFIAALPHPQVWAGLLAVAARFPDRGPVNCMLITAQRPDASDLRGYREWQQAGRQVRKGEHGVRVYAPCRPRTPGQSQDDSATPPAAPRLDQDDGATGTDGVTRFTTHAVFDIAQTDGDPVAPSIPAHPTPKRILDALREQLARVWDIATVTTGIGEVKRPEIDPATGTIRLPEHADPAPVAREVLVIVARLLIGDHLDPRVSAASAQSTAHLAARMLGLPPGPAPVPPVQEPGEMTDGTAPVRTAAVTVITAARELVTSLATTSTPQDPARPAGTEA